MDKPVSISDYIAGQVCHGCHSVGRFYDERKQVWWCRPCIVLMGQEAMRRSNEEGLDGFIRSLRPKSS